MNRTRTALLFQTILAFCALAAGPMAIGDETEPLPEEVLIYRALSFIQADAVKWRQEKNCSTCHHGTMTMWVQLEAKQKGFAVSSEEFDENVRWAKQRIMERADLPRDTRPGWSMVNTPAIYVAIMAHAVPDQSVISADDLDRIRGHLLRHQEENGAWMWSSAPPKNVPPPFFESDEVATRLAILALTLMVKPVSEDSETTQSSLAKANSWLARQPPTDTTQAAVLRLMVQQLDHAPDNEMKHAVEQLTGLQNNDGGWSQITGMSSDAYATGQVLYALSVAGISQEDAAVKRAVSFLVSTQQHDGSWPMKKRTHPGETPTDNLVPITYFGTSWATLGLLQSVPALKSPGR